MKTKYIMAGLIGLVSITGALLYLQYRRLMDYTIKIKNFYIRSFDVTSFVADFYLDYENKSSLSFDINSQNYTVFINNVQIAAIGNKNIIKIKPGHNNVSVRVAANPQKAFNDLNGIQGILKMVASQQSASVKIVMNFNVKMYGLNFKIPFTYESAIKDMLAKKKQ